MCFGDFLFHLCYLRTATFIGDSSEIGNRQSGFLHYLCAALNIYENQKRSDMEPVIVIPALGDNFAYLFRYQQNKAIAVDPADASLVLNEIKKYNLELTAILATHHHADHTAGIRELKHKTNRQVIIGNQDLADNQILNFGNYRVRIIPTPGHTSDSVCFYIEPSGNNGGIVFTGDTLFVAGCGRPIGCEARTMWNSLQKLADLPDNTLVYPGHDYTEENYEFALTIEPENKTIQKLLADIREKQKEGKPTVPSTIAQEKQTNIFLRANTTEIKAAINMPEISDGEVFVELRRKKNIFG
jgi:hydroxyacylglutathione hydrolase